MGSAILLGSVTVLGAGVRPTIAADSSSLSPSATVSPNGWQNPGNALNGSDDGNVATTATADADQGYRNFGFTLPAGSIVNGITVQVEAASSDSSGCQLGVSLSGNAGGSFTARKAANLTGTSTLLTFGGASDDWGLVWDASQLSNTNFRLVTRNLDPGSACTNGSTTSVDRILMTVSYSTIANGTSNATVSSAVCDTADFNFIVDMSGSIGPQGSIPSNLQQLKDGINGFVDSFQAAGGDGRYSGTRFNGSSASAVTAGYTAAGTFQTAVNALSGPTGLTPTSLGINTGAANNAGDRAGVPNIMFVVTDGSPNKPNSHSDDLTNPDTWYTAANAAVASANTARAGSGASQYIVEAVYLSTAGDPGDTNLPFSDAGDAAWAQAVMTRIGGGSYFPADFKSFADDLLKAIGCAPPSLTIATQVNRNGQSLGDNGHLTIGGAVTDVATVSGTQGAVAGTVKFLSCFDASSVPDCSTGGTDRGTKTISNGSATSDAFTPAAVGNYCFRVEYTPAAGSKYLAASHTNSTSECFVVDKKQPAITTTQDQTVSLGNAIADTASLAGATADAGGHIVFRAYGPGDPTCSNAPGFTSASVPVSGNGSYGPVSFTPTTAGTYRWIASYSGDAKNAAAIGQCNDTGETDIVTKVDPTIATQASSSVTVGGKISDTATVSGGANPTGTVSFALYGPGDTDCSKAPIFTSANRSLSGGQATSAEFTTTQAGTYRWVATYSGDVNNTSVQGTCNDANENVVVSPTTPGITTQLVGDGKTGASITVPLGTAVHDTSALTNVTPNAGGTVHYRVFADTQCTNLMSDAGTANVVNGVPANSISVTFNAAGTYYWQADYSGDANNGSATSACNLETVAVDKNIPTITTTASATVAVGGQIHDTAHLAGGFNPTGSITFKLYGPDDASCAGAVVFSDSRTVNGNGDYVSSSYTANAAGTYRWIASYSGDGNDAAVAGGCNDANENVDVTTKSPDIATQATAGAQVGDQIHDTATVTGGFNPTGTVTFKLYGPADPKCDGSAIFTSTVALQSDGTATSGTYTVTQKGTFQWVASYSGDANNDPARGTCGDAGETTVVNQFSPDIATALHSGDLSGAKISVIFGSSVTDQATLSGQSATAGGTVAYTVYTDSSCTAVFANAGSKTVTNGVVAPSDAVAFPAAGIYYWQASYSGDAANAPAISPCTDEVVTVTTPNLHVEKTVSVGSDPFGHSSTAVPGDVVSYRITVHNSGNSAATNVPVSDDISAILAHATYNGDCSNSCSFASNTLTWTIPSVAVDGTVTLTFSVTLSDTFPTGTTHLPNVVVVIGAGSNCARASEDPDCGTDTTVTTSAISIDKSLTGNSAGTDPDLGVPAAKVGDTLHYVLTYHSAGPIADAVITDVLPQGLAYVGGSAAGDANFTFDSYDSATRTLKWINLSGLPDPSDGHVTYDVKVTAAAPEFAQPLINVATIVGHTPDEQELTDSDSAAVSVLAPPEELTPPPTNTITPETVPSNPGYALALILLGIAGLALGIGVMTPTPERVRRRDGRR